MNRLWNRALLLIAPAAACCALPLLGACAASGPVPEAPPPRRPEEIAAPEPEVEVPDDCQPADPSQQPPPVAYRERSIVEARNLADEGFRMLRRAEDPKLPRAEQEELITQSVDRFITALLADPYNVHATYNLAAAYARIGRGQCAVNLLGRLALLHRLPSQHDAVEDKLDRLLGRGRFRNDLDPDFDELRGDERFREVITKFHK